MIRELRFGMRMLLKQPAFSLIAILTLALGIGSTSAVFSLIQGVLLTPPPYRQPERLVLIPTARADGQPMTSAQGWPAAQWLDWQKESKTLESIAAYDWSFNFLVLPEGSQSMEGMYVTRDYFSVVGLPPALAGPSLRRKRDPRQHRSLFSAMSSGSAISTVIETLSAKPSG